ncbi:MAG: murein hydrolase activator EnvC family protein [Armatimonadota bacterium]
MNRSRIFIISSVLVCFISAMAIQSPVNAVNLKGLKNKLQSTARSIRSVESKLRQTKHKQKSAAKQLALSERKLQVTRSSLRDIQSQLHTTRVKLNKTDIKLKETKKKLNKRSNQLSLRLVDSYKHGSVTYAGVVLGSTDIWDFLSRSYFLKKIVQSDTDLIQDIKEDKRLIELHKNILADQATKRVQLEYKHRTLTRVAYNQTAERGKILHSIETERAKYESMLAELERDSNSIASMIRRMERTPRGSKRLTQVWRGSFMKPVSGSISSGFGSRFHPILKRRKLHTGVDIAAPYGSTIKAAGNGDVIYAGWFGAYGNTVIIDHGGGMTTLYGHCSRITIRNGASVKRGQAIAKVGSTGWSTGNHCHFEVRRHGAPVNPL